MCAFEKGDPQMNEQSTPPHSGELSVDESRTPEQSDSTQTADETSEPKHGFAAFEALDPRLVETTRQLGFREPTPIQAMAIPPLLEGRDVIGQAQTGTGKTAAFALPLLSRLETNRREVQVLVLTPTRELAIQVAEAIDEFAKLSREVRTLAVYGGADIRGQLTGLKRNPQIVVGTPGRVMDHMRRGSLDVSNLNALVLDEADEMLRMGFREDVEWVLQQAPRRCQKALFSATMSGEIRTIARTHLPEAAEMTVKSRTTTAEAIEQRYWEVRGMHRLDALSRILEAEETDGVLVFTRTKAASVKLADQLEQRGFAAEALNGDLPQAKREQVVERFRRGRTDILVATDVAARGLDVERISHVVNYDLPHDSEAYTHRIGRTGRAGRRGMAILFLSPRDRRVLNTIERATRQTIEPYSVPTVAQVMGRRIEAFKLKLIDSLEREQGRVFHEMLDAVAEQTGADPLEIAAAAVALVPGVLPGSQPGRSVQPRYEEPLRSDRSPRNERTERGERRQRPSHGGEFAPRRERKRAKESREKTGEWIDAQMERFRVEVGYEHGVNPGNIVGAIANESGLESKYIGRIVINDDHSTVDLPEGMPREIMKELQGIWVSGQQLRISRTGEKATRPSGKGNGAPAKGHMHSRSFASGAGKQKKSTMRRKSA